MLIICLFSTSFITSVFIGKNKNFFSSSEKYFLDSTFIISLPTSKIVGQIIEVESAQKHIV